MSKFKVGDRVYAKGNIKGCEGRGTIVDVDKGHKTFEYRVCFDDHPGSGIWAFNNTIMAIETPKIIITTNGTTTLARLYEGNRVTKTAEAKCGPDDEFCFATGANLAYDRLMGRDMETTPDDNAEKEPIKLYCAKNLYRWHTLIKGLVYEIDADGHMRIDETDNDPGIYKDFADFARRNPSYAACLVPLVKRPAKVGEWVYITKSKSTQNRFAQDDVLRVKELWCLDGWVFLDCGGYAAMPSEYLVLDGYQPEPEEPKYYSGKVVCIASAHSFWTVGRVYEIIDGVIKDNTEEKRECIIDIEQLNAYSGGVKFAKFIGE